MSDLFEQIKTIADLQNQAIQSGVELGRSESAARIAFLEERNAKLLEALKGMLSISDLWIPATVSEEHADEVWALCSARDMMLRAINEEGE